MTLDREVGVGFNSSCSSNPVHVCLEYVLLVFFLPAVFVLPATIVLLLRCFCACRCYFYNRAWDVELMCLRVMNVRVANVCHTPG